MAEVPHSPLDPHPLGALYRETPLPEDVVPQEIQDKAGQTLAAAQLQYRRTLKSLEDSRHSLRRIMDVLHGYEDALTAPAQASLCQFTEATINKQTEAVDVIVTALESLDQSLREKVPAQKAPMLLLPDKEEWHIKIGFDYPDAANPDRLITYGAGEPIPPNMTQADLDSFYMQGFIYRFVKNPETGEGVFKPHPKLVELSPRQMLQLVGESVPFVCNFLERNYIRLNTLLALKVKIAEFEESQRPVDQRIKDKLDKKIANFEDLTKQ